MALGVMILSTDSKKPTAFMIGADEREAKELANTFTVPSFTFVNVGGANIREARKALDYYMEAWKRICDRWEEINAKD